MSKVDVEKDKKSLKQIHRDMILDQNSDVEKEYTYFTEDAFVIPPNGPPVVGADNIQEVMRGDG